MSKTERVLVVGGGFGGVKAALELAEDSRFQITLLSDDTDLRYYPTLYHTATGGKRANSSIPLARIFEDRNVTLATGRAVALDRKAKTVTTEDGTAFGYDSLILALGVVTNYFGIPGMQEYSYSIKTQTEVSRFKAHLH
ncbi:MAG TPA: FAD-dependent oxidoreductase, partial [Verrucomicrobiae bacterium]|nr:FAD-dependent oxidoreductase [Verrucomicrobiae bacterium]